MRRKLLAFAFVLGAASLHTSPGHAQAGYDLEQMQNQLDDLETDMMERQAERAGREAETRRLRWELEQERWRVREERADLARQQADVAREQAEMAHERHLEAMRMIAARRAREAMYDTSTFQADPSAPVIQAPSK